MAEKIRMLNGYRVIFKPDCSRAMSSDNWSGYVYEHILIAEQKLGRTLTKNEVVHHLDGNRSNNRSSNLLVLERSQHAKLHNWLQAGAPGLKNSVRKGMNSGESKVTEPLYCNACGITLQERQKSYCSNSCRGMAERKVSRPSSEQLAEDMKTMSWSAMGRLYGVSDNGVRKWARQYKLL